MIFAPVPVRVADQEVLLVGLQQDYVCDETYVTTIRVVGHLHCNSSFMPLANMPFEVLNWHTAYITDAERIGCTTNGEFIFEYELTVRERLHYIMGG